MKYKSRFLKAVQDVVVRAYLLLVQSIDGRVNPRISDSTLYPFRRLHHSITNLTQ